GAARVARNQDVIGIPFGDAGRNRANSNFRHEFHAHSSRRVAVLQIVDQLLQILDRIDVMMRWWADETDAWSRVTNSGDVGIHLAAGQLAALAGLRTL